MERNETRGAQPRRFATDDARWQAVAERDGAADGEFWYAVVTTGIYCRPGCASRPPRLENVRFYPHPREAEEAGFRACLRCRPADELRNSR